MCDVKQETRKHTKKTGNRREANENKGGARKAEKIYTHC